MLNPRFFPQLSCSEWSGKRDSNPRPSAWKADALPTELFPHLPEQLPTLTRIEKKILKMVEREGFEPSKACAARFTVWSLWPLGYLSEPIFYACLLVISNKNGAGEGIRTRDLRFTKPLLYQLSYSSPYFYLEMTNSK
jgi:hypothetical protein